MQATILLRSELAIESASALERTDQSWWLIGDDAYDLQRLDDNFEMIGKLNILDKPTPDAKKAEKKVKADLEAMARVQWKGHDELLLFGSGSKVSLRDKCVRVDISDPVAPKLIDTISLTALYDVLRAEPRMIGLQKLNLEAATVAGDNILLFHRGNIAGVNGIASYAKAAFMEFLDRKGALPLPPLQIVTSIELPILQQRHSGFSAAVTLSDSVLLVAASVEDTPDEIQDGPTLGSYIGLLERKKSNPLDWQLRWCAVIEANGVTAPVKVEGISLKRLDSMDEMTVIAVTDSDGGASECLEIRVTPKVKKTDL